VMSGGEWIVEDGHHREEAAVLSRYRAAMKRLAS